MLDYVEESRRLLGNELCTQEQIQRAQIFAVLGVVDALEGILAELKHTRPLTTTVSFVPPDPSEDE